jgi:hypothetical protein
MRNVILVLGLLLALSAANATTAEDWSKLADDLLKSNGSTRAVLNAYDKMLPDGDGRRQIETLISGMATGLLWANAELHQRGQRELYCQPEKLKLTTGQIIDMMRRTTKDIPKSGDLPLGFVVLGALQRTFPCQ